MLLFASVGNASAATIYACADKSSGGVRFVSATTVCKNNELRYSWNEAGSPGPQGPVDNAAVSFSYVITR
jgi:hypothetical protein